MMAFEAIGVQCAGFLDEPSVTTEVIVVNSCELTLTTEARPVHVRINDVSLRTCSNSVSL